MQRGFCQRHLDDLWDSFTFRPYCVTPYYVFFFMACGNESCFDSTLSLGQVDVSHNVLVIGVCLL